MLIKCVLGLDRSALIHISFAISQVLFFLTASKTTETSASPLLPHFLINSSGFVLGKASNSFN